MGLDFVIIYFFPSYHNVDIWQCTIHVVSNYFDKFIEATRDQLERLFFKLTPGP